MLWNHNHRYFKQSLLLPDSAPAKLRYVVIITQLWKPIEGNCRCNHHHHLRACSFWNFLTLTVCSIAVQPLCHFRNCGLKVSGLAMVESDTIASQWWCDGETVLQYYELTKLSIYNFSKSWMRAQKLCQKMQASKLLGYSCQCSPKQNSRHDRRAWCGWSL